MKKVVLLIMCFAVFAAGCSANTVIESTEVSEAPIIAETGDSVSKLRGETAEVMLPELETEDWSEHYDRVVSSVYGDDFHTSYSMEDIVGTTDDDNFLCEYKKLKMSLADHCILLAQEKGDGTERTVIYDIDVISGECAITYDNDEGISTVIWSGKGKAQDTATIKLGEGANCLRLEAIGGDTELKLKLQCVK